MKKILLITFLLGALLSVNAQVPSYVPSNGLIGWYPFNGNANDESGNANHGTVNGPVLSIDRKGLPNSAFNFQNANDRITVNGISNSNVLQYSICGWFKKSSNSINSEGNIVSTSNPLVTKGLRFAIGSNNQATWGVEDILANGSVWSFSKNQNYSDNNWHFFVVVLDASPGVVDSSFLKIWIDNVEIPKIQKVWGNQNSVQAPISNSNLPMIIGNATGANVTFKGVLDDIGVYNRALSSSEIADIFAGCKVIILNEPSNQSSSINAQAQFNVVLNDTTASYQWQSNHASMGWSNIPSNSVYSGVTSKKLTVNNIKVNNHKQLFRVIATKNTCKDTSVVAMLTVNDTCITSTTDTLYIKVNTSSLSNPVYNTVKVYPNPSSTQVIIDNGNFSTMGSYTAKIVNSIGQQVFQSVINQQQFVVDAKTMGGAGVYTLYIIDSNNKVVGVKKIVLQ